MKNMRIVFKKHYDFHILYLYFISILRDVAFKMLYKDKILFIHFHFFYLTDIYIFATLLIILSCTHRDKHFTVYIYIYIFKFLPKLVYLLCMYKTIHNKQRYK